MYTVWMKAGLLKAEADRYLSFVFRCHWRLCSLEGSGVV